MEVAIRDLGAAIFLFILAIYSLIYLEPNFVEFYVLIVSIIITAVVFVLALRELFKLHETGEPKK